MATVERSVRIHSSATSAFRYLSDPLHLKDYCVNVVEISDVERHPSEHTKFAWVYKMVGVRLEGKAEVVPEKHDQELHFPFQGGIHGSLTWRLYPNHEGILLEIKLEYTIPEPLLKKHTAEAIERENELHLEAMLTVVKALLEAEYARTFHRV